MGASTSWLAVKGKSREAILETLGLQIASPKESEHVGPQGCQFPDGWYVVVAGDYLDKITTYDVLKQISTGCNAIAGGVETHVMASTAMGWRNGERIWFVEHLGETDVEHLKTEGELPAIFKTIEESARAKQAAKGRECGVDFIFDVPVKLCSTLTGYDYDGSGSDEDWHLLDPASKKSWLQRFLAR